LQLMKICWAFLKRLISLCTPDWRLNRASRTSWNRAEVGFGTNRWISLWTVGPLLCIDMVSENWKYINVKPIIASLSFIDLKLSDKFKDYFT
jgi:hypothetical protein